MASAWAVIQRDGRLLLVKRSERSSRPGQWCLPGGGIRAGESAAQACLREVFEETGLTAVVARQLLEEEQQSYFQCSSVEGELILQPEECSDSVWIAPEQLLTVGPVMELRRLVRVLDLVGIKVEVPSS